MKSQTAQTGTTFNPLIDDGDIRHVSKPKKTFKLKNPIKGAMKLIRSTKQTNVPTQPSQAYPVCSAYPINDSNYLTKSQSAQLNKSNKPNKKNL